MNRKIKLALNITSYILIGIIFILALLVLMISLTTKAGDVPKLFGTSVVSVQSNSMKGEFNKGDLITLKRISAAEKNNLKEGEIITFLYKDGTEMKFNTHKIVGVEIISGDAHYTTRGIGLDAENKQIPQDASGNDKDKVVAVNIIGVYKGRIPGLGAVLDFFDSKVGFGLLIVLPLFAFLAYRVYVVIKLVLAINKEKKQGTTLSEMEAMQAEIARLKAELGTAPADNSEPKPEAKA